MLYTNSAVYNSLQILFGNTFTQRRPQCRSLAPHGVSVMALQSTSQIGEGFSK